MIRLRLGSIRGRPRARRYAASAISWKSKLKVTTDSKIINWWWLWYLHHINIRESIMVAHDARSTQGFASSSEGMKLCLVISGECRDQSVTSSITGQSRWILYNQLKSLITAFNFLGPSDAIWRQRSGSTLAQVMACCLMAPSHYLNQCWLIIRKVEWHSSKGKFTRDTSAINH